MATPREFYCFRIFCCMLTTHLWEIRIMKNNLPYFYCHELLNPRVSNPFQISFEYWGTSTWKNRNSQLHAASPCLPVPFASLSTLKGCSLVTSCNQHYQQWRRHRRSKWPVKVAIKIRWLSVGRGAFGLALVLTLAVFRWWTWEGQQKTHTPNRLPGRTLNLLLSELIIWDLTHQSLCQLLL